MKTKFLIKLFFQTLGCTFIFSQQPLKTSMFWEITGNNLQKPSYLFGTIHILCKEDFTISKKVIDKLKTCEVMYQEFDPNNEFNDYVWFKNLKWNNSLKAVLKDSLYKIIADKFNAITQLNLAIGDSINPYETTSFVFQKILGCKKYYYLEFEFTKLAIANYLYTNGLVTTEEHMAVIDSLPKEEVVNNLLYTILNADLVKINFKKTVENYKQGILEDFAYTTTDSLKNNKWNDIMLSNRNKKWITKIKEQMPFKPAFFVMGFKHLIGETGIIKLLQNLGYTVKPIEF